MKYRSCSIRSAIMLMALMFVGHAVHAAETDIANAPLASSSSAVVKPNVMFILDDSGSMAWSYLGDDVYSKNYVNKVGYRSAICNKAYYNPAVKYALPASATGTYPAPPFDKALYDGFKDGSITIDLNSEFMAWRSKSSLPKHPTGYGNENGDCWGSSSACIPPTTGSNDIPNTKSAAYYFIYKGSKSANLGDNSNDDHCKSDNSNYSSNWTKVTVSATSGAGATDERQNFANWYSFYRTRMLAMKSSAGLAFKNVNDKYRVGYSTISYADTDSSDYRFLKIGDFDVTHKASFYEKLYKADPVSSTPLRAALSKAGRLYAGKLLTGADDPVQYSCQQNFAILSTDGYWNTSGESSSYGPKGLDGTTDVGNQDANELRPMYDGTVTSNVTYTTATLTVSGSDDTKVTSIKVNGQEIMSGATNSDDRSRDVASRIADKISRNGYTATVSGSVVTIKAPTSAGPITYTPVVAKSGGMSITATAFSSTTNSVTTGGVSNSLADVAAYYYNTDLRTSPCRGALGGDIDVCANNVVGSGADNKASQHMTTFTLGLGVNGQLKYSEDYLNPQPPTGGSADYEAIKSGPTNWPTPVADTPTAIDDLWHTAVNGRGTYFSAQTPDSLVKGIVKALTSAEVKDGSGAAAATSNLEPVAGDNFLFLAMYRTSFWDGDLKAKTIDPSTGAIADTESWSAQQKLDLMVGPTSDSRTIYTFSGDASNKLKEFRWDNLTDEKAYFNNICSPTVKLSQCNDSINGPNLSQGQKDLIPGENLLKFIRGQTGYEDQAGNANPIYRDREHVLGDMIGSQPVYVKAPPFAYVDDNYDAFKAYKKDRLAMVYVAANDGMLHAFDATIGQTNSGTEKWAYIPPMVLPNLYKLAAKDYAANHQYYVDGAPTVGDICPNAPAAACGRNDWKSILVGGLNAGGKGYYALDITDPENPKALWNFTVTNDVDIGYSYGNPVITKRRDGTWVVVFTSGYNNHSDGGDGKGHLYVLNANTGVRLSKLDTTEGDTSTPSGLAKINAWIDSTSDNTAKRFYGGDLLGNVWRFDPDDRIGEAGNTVTLLAELGNVLPIGTQPVTIKPELTEITSAGIDHAVVNIATGRYLGVSDVSDVSIQSIYSLKDNLTEAGLGKVRTAGVLVQQTLITSADGSTRTTSTNPVNWTDKSGWYMDLNPGNKSPGERVNVDMQQQLGLLTVAGNVPKGNACTPGGNAWIYSLDFKTGQYVEGADGNVAGRPSTGLVAGLKTLKLNTGKTITLVTDTGGDITVFDDPSSNPGSGNGARRVSWRELIID